MFSKACEYGIKATLFVAQSSLRDERVSLTDVATEIKSPVAFTAKILQQLSRVGILSSTKGPNGGFEIEKKQIQKITLHKVVDTIDGDSIYKGCALGLDKCSDSRPCPIHDRFVSIRDELKDMLESTTLYELAAGLETGLTFLKR